MTFIVYGLRIQGDKEVRYIGQTKDTEQRLAGHFASSRSMPWATDFANWLIDNKDEIEIIQLAQAETREDARRVERAMVGVFLSLDHRLFNQWLVPAGQRCNPRTSEPPARFRRWAA